MQNNQNKHEIVKQFIPKLLKVTDKLLHSTINEKFHTTGITEVTDVLKNIADALDILISISYLFAKENVESNIENLTKLSNNITNVSDKTDNQNLKSIVINLCKQILEKIDCLKYQIKLHQIVNERQTIGFTFDKPISKEEIRRILDGNN